MTILANHLRSLAADLLKVADAMQALEAERDEYRRMAKLTAEIIHREALPMSFAEVVQVEALRREG